MSTDVSFAPLLVVALIAVGAPLLVGAFHLRVPAPVLELRHESDPTTCIAEWGRCDDYCGVHVAEGPLA